ncbi:MAG: hypothetical protein AB7G28_22775 [Pirellulales bacterium]
MIVVKYKLTGIEALSRSQVIDAVKAALRRLGALWHEAFAWKRFTKLGYTEYGFQSRSTKYDKYKLRHRGHTNPLMLTGEARDQLLSSSTVARIRVSRDTLRIPMPTKLNRYNPAGPNMADEVRAVSKDELRQLSDALVIFIEDELDKQVPPQARNRGEIGGRVRKLELRIFKPSRGVYAPAQRRAA